MSTPAPDHRARVVARQRTITRASLTVLTAVLFVAVIYFRELEFITAALLTGVAGVAIDVRQTKKLACVRRRR
jgi:hypothetical protein